MMDKIKPKIIVLGTGGTIASVAENPNNEYYHAPSIPIAEIIQSIPRINEIANIECRQFSQIISHYVNTDLWLQLANEVQQILNSDVDGIVITQGTNALEETAYFLNLVIKSNKPIVITGASVPSNSLGGNALSNLYHALIVACDLNAKAKGVLVVFNHRILAARFAEKKHIAAMDSIGINELGILGMVQGAKAYFFFSPTYLHTLKTEFDIKNIKSLPKVTIIYAHIDAGSFALRNIASENIQGIISVGFGKGFQTPDICQELINLHKNLGIPVVRISRSWGNGLVTVDESCDEGKLFIAGNNFSPQKAHILLALALTKTQSPQQIQKLFDQH